MTTRTYRTRAAFLKAGRWTWLWWNHQEPSKHAAIIDKATEIGAQGWDFGQADHALLSEWNHGSRG